MATSGLRGNGPAAVLRTVLDRGPIARSTIARLVGLSPASVTGHTGRLIDLELLRERPETAPQRSAGRPHVPLDLNCLRYVAGGIHIGLQHITVALVDLRGGVIVQQRQPHEGTDPETVLGRAVSILDDLVGAHADGREPLGIGVATGGWVDRDSGNIIEHPMLGWRNVAVGRLIGERGGLAVRVDGHSRALVNAERLFGSAPSSGSTLGVFVGTVVDAAFAIGDRVQHGPRSQAGTIAHLPVLGSTEACRCGRAGCLQAAVSEQTIARRALEQDIVDEPDFAAVLAEARTGNPAAKGLFAERMRLLGRAVALLVDTLNPDLIVVAEPAIVALPDCLPRLRKEVAAHSSLSRDIDKTLIGTSFPGRVLATAAGAVILDALYRDPVGFLQRRDAQPDHRINSRSRNIDTATRLR